MVDTNVVDELVHTVAAPDIVPASGNGLIVMMLDVDTDPQALATVYITVSTPAETPVIVPDGEASAWALSTEKVPPLVVSVKLMILPTQTLDPPVMLPAVTGGCLTVKEL